MALVRDCRAEGSDGHPEEPDIQDTEALGETPAERQEKERQASGSMEAWPQAVRQKGCRVAAEAHHDISPARVARDADFDNDRSRAGCHHKGDAGHCAVR